MIELFQRTIVHVTKTKKEIDALLESILVRRFIKDPRPAAAGEPSGVQFAAKDQSAAVDAGPSVKKQAHRCLHMHGPHIEEPRWRCLLPSR